MVRTWILMAVVLTVGAAGGGQHRHDQAGGPISTLTAEEITRLEAGDGMGMARAAELNHYPGPKHALELAAELGLTEAQAGKARAIRERMLADAVRFGAVLIEKETTLHVMFATRHVNEASMREMTAAIGAIRGELRATHLAAHLAMAEVLTADQVRRYDELRGHE